MTHRPKALILAVAFCFVALPARATAELVGLDVAKQCLPAPYDSLGTPAGKQLRALLDRIAAAGPELKQFEELLVNPSPTLCIDTRPISERGYYDVELNLIALSAALTPDEMLAILIHELRHADQLTRGYCPSNEVSMSENARATFAVEADAMAMTALAAWVLREIGDPGPWQAMLDWTRYADIAEVFEAEATASRSISRAATAAFGQWYASEWRITSYYRSSCADYLDRQDRTHALPRYDLLPTDFMANLCRLPDGGSYDCEAP